MPSRPRGLTRLRPHVPQRPRILATPTAPITPTSDCGAAVTSHRGQRPIATLRERSASVQPAGAGVGVDWRSILHLTWRRTDAKRNERSDRLAVRSYRQPCSKCFPLSGLLCWVFMTETWNSSADHSEAVPKEQPLLCPPRIGFTESVECGFAPFDWGCP